MRLSQYLDLEEGGQLLDQAGHSWKDWTDQEPRLAGVDYDELYDWLRHSSPAEADEVLHALASLAALDGGDDAAAAAVLARALLPGACTLARRIRHLEGDTQLLVASQLWIEVRSFEWRQRRRVAANILRNTRAGCLRAAGAASQTKRADPAWAVTDLVDPSSFFWTHVAAGARMSAADAWSARPSHHGEDEPMLRPTRRASVPPERRGQQQVAELLAWACDTKVISAPDRELLLCLIEQADEVDTVRLRCANYGLTANEISKRVAPRVGLSQATVRRRAARSIQAMAAAATERYVA